MVAKIEMKHLKAFPVIEWISQRHDRFLIAQILNDWEFKHRYTLPKPEIVVTDFSWALLHGVSEAFGKHSLENQIKIQWQMMTGTEITCTILRICANHQMHTFCRRLKIMNVSSKVAILFLFMYFSNLF